MRNLILVIGLIVSTNTSAFGAAAETQEECEFIQVSESEIIAEASMQQAGLGEFLKDCVRTLGEWICPSPLRITRPQPDPIEPPATIADPAPKKKCIKKWRRPNSESSGLGNP